MMKEATKILMRGFKLLGVEAEVVDFPKRPPRKALAKLRGGDMLFSGKTQGDADVQTFSYGTVGLCHKPNSGSLKGENLIMTSNDIVSDKDKDSVFVWHGLVADATDLNSSLPIRPVFEDLTTLELVTRDVGNDAAVYTSRTTLCENELEFDCIHDIGKVKFNPCEYLNYENTIDYWRKSKTFDEESGNYIDELRIHGATSGTSRLEMTGFVEMDKRWLKSKQLKGLGEGCIAVVGGKGGAWHLPPILSGDSGSFTVDSNNHVISMISGFTGTIATVLGDYIVTWVASNQLPFYGARYDILQSLAGYKVENFGDFNREHDEAIHIRMLRGSAGAESGMETARKKTRNVQGFSKNNVPKIYNIRQIKENEEWIWHDSVSAVEKENSLICLQQRIDAVPAVGYVVGYHKSTIDKMKKNGINVNLIENPSEEQVQAAWENSFLGACACPQKLEASNLKEIGQVLTDIGTLLMDKNSNESNDRK